MLMVALQVRAHEPTDNNTVIDGHFIKDSVLVMVSGAVYGSVVEAICYPFIQPHPDRALYCKTFAADSLAFINLLRAQQPVWALATCKHLNLLLIVIASGYIGSTQFRPATIRTVLASVLCYQLGRISVDCAAYYFGQPDLYNLKPDLIGYVVLNGISAAWLVGSLTLWHGQNLGGGLKLLVLTLASTGTALLSTEFYMILIESEKPFSILERVAAGALVVAGAGADAVGGTLAVAVAGAGARVSAGARAVAGVVTGAITGAEVEVEVEVEVKVKVKVIAVALTGAGAIAGALIIITTRFLLQRLSNAEQPHTISRNLAQLVLVSVPFLVSSWLLSVNQWVMNNVSVHETMQRVYYPDTARALFSGEWIKALYHQLWLKQTSGHPKINTAELMN